MNDENGVKPTEVAEQPAAEKIDKIIARRLSESREQLAVALGFDSWDSAMNSGYDKKLLDAGIDPKVGKPIIDNLVSNHPEVQAAKQVLAEAKEQRIAAEITALNTKYGLNIESFDQLDDETKNLVAKGVALSRAYVAIHYDELSGNPPQKDPIDVAKTQLNSSKAHLTSLPGGNASSQPNSVNITAADIENVRRFMPNASDASIKEFLQKHPEIKI